MSLGSYCLWKLAPKAQMSSFQARCLHRVGREQTNKVVADAIGASPISLDLDLQCTGRLTSTPAPAFVSLPGGFLCPPESPLPTHTVGRKYGITMGVGV